MKRRTIRTGCMMLLGVFLCLGLAACGGEKMQYDGLNLDDYITVGEYKGLEVDGYKIKVSEKEIQEKVEAALKEKQENQKLDEKTKLKKGDTANIDYTGKVDGKEFDGGASQGFDLELGSGQFIEGFEDGLIGHRVGESVEVKVHFPDDYQGEKVAGKDAVFTVKINSATRPKIPEYTVDFVKENTDFQTKEEYEESIRQDIYNEKEETAKTEQKNSLWSDVLENTEVKKYPEEEMEAYQKVFDAQIDTMAQQYGMSRSDILKQMYGADDEKTVKSIIEDSTKTLIKQELLTEYIADKENLTYSKDEKQAKLDEIEKQGYDDETVQQYTGRTLEQYAHITLLYEKVQDFILDNSKVKK
ncbi:MAG: trigger factor [Firmicutes bacterium]|nr:trigger factor [Bacillota bacterium]